MRLEVIIMGARKSGVSHARPDLSCTHYFQAHATQATSYSGQYKAWTADCGLGIKYGLGLKRGLENTDWVLNMD